MEHTCEVANASRMLVTCYLLGANAEGYHHERNLRDGGEGKHTLDVCLGTCHSSSIESGEDTHPNDDAHSLGSILNPQREHACNLEHTGNHHSSGVNERADRSRTFHSIGQPDVQREHGRLTGTTDEHQHKRGRDDETARCDCLGHITRDERLGALPHHDVTGKREAERLGVIAEEQDTDEEEEVGKTCYDERLLRCGNGSMSRVIETDEEIRAHTHKLPEEVHLEDVRGKHESEHRHGEERKEGIVALESLLALHVAERVDVNHEADRGNHYEHHHRDGVEQDAQVEVKIA